MKNRVIVALDVPNRSKMVDLLDRLEGRPLFYKIGLELFTAEGIKAIEEVQKRGSKVFLDLKLHDIPKTVERTVRVIRSMGVSALTIHIPGGCEMMERAHIAADERLKIFGVTVLTSLNQEDLSADGVSKSVNDVAMRRIQIAKDNFLDGLVCSAHEVFGAKVLAPRLIRFVPGIRPAGSTLGDQRRTATPKEAIDAGADFIVVGRPIRDAKDPAAAFNAIVKEISE